MKGGDAKVRAGALVLGAVVCAAQPPVTVAQSVGSPAPQFLTGSGVKVPPNYSTMKIPAPGTTYVDPVFATVIRRVTNAAAIGEQGIVPEYSESSSFNRNDTYLLLFRTFTGVFELRDGAGNYLRNVNGARPRWSRRNANYLYYNRSGSNAVIRQDVSNGSTTTLRTFPEYGSIDFGNGQGDISDNDRVALIGDDRYVFVYDLATNTKYGVLDTATLPNGPNAASVTPDGDGFVVTWNGAGGAGRGRGMERFDLNGNFVAQILNVSAHGSSGRDVDGTQVYFVTNVATVPQQPDNCFNGIVKVSLDSRARRTCLLPIVNRGGHWGTEVHISGLARDGWAYVSAFRVGAQVSGWTAHDMEIFRVRADGSIVERLAHHRSSAAHYWAEPHANVSISGRKLVYGSDFDPILGEEEEDEELGRVETFVIDLPLARAEVLAPGGTIATGTPGFRWSRVAGSTWYYLWVNDLGSASNPVIQRWYSSAEANCSAAGCAVPAPQALANGSYRVWVRAWNPGTLGVWSAPRDFTVAGAATAQSVGLAVLLDSTEALIAATDELLDDGAVDRRLRMPLAAKLEAVASTLRGDTVEGRRFAEARLRAFAEQVSAFSRSGDLPSAAAQSLIRGAEALAARIGARR